MKQRTQNQVKTTTPTGGVTGLCTLKSNKMDYIKTNPNFTDERVNDIKTRYIKAHNQEWYDSKVNANMSYAGRYYGGRVLFCTFNDLMVGDFIRNFFGIPYEIIKIDKANRTLDIKQNAPWNEVHTMGNVITNAKTTMSWFEVFETNKKV